MNKANSNTQAATQSDLPGECITFNNEQLGMLPAGWMAGVTGRGTPRWTIEADPADAERHVLKQSGEGTFPWCVREAVDIEDGFVEVKFQPIAGDEDQAGGVVWRWKDRDNYYVARANALENNVSLYYTKGGRRVTIKYTDAPVASAQWHTLRAEFSASTIRVLLDGKLYIAVADEHIAGPGSVGVWTKADSVTAFDEFNWGATAS